MNKNIANMPDPREQEMLRKAIGALAEEEVRAAQADDTLDADCARALDAALRHIDAAAKPHSRPRRRLRIVAVIAAALVVFSGACMASEEVRGNMIALVETAFGRNVQIHAEETSGTDAPVTVASDDVRLRYVHPDWCLHYYPLEIPSHFTKVDVAYGQPRTATMITHTTASGNMQSWESGFYYLTDEARAKWLEEDYQEIIFTSIELDGRFYQFIEDGRANNEARLDSISQNITRETICGKEVLVVEDDGLLSFIWQEGGHLLTLTSNDERVQMEYVFSTVERIR